MVGKVLRKTFRFGNTEKAVRTLVCPFSPEVVHVEKLAGQGWITFPWSAFSVEHREIHITLPPGEYTVTAFGGDPQDIERWETDGGKS